METSPVKVIIAEKPSVARAFAGVIGGGRRREGYIDCSSANVQVTWCLGHLLEQARPGDYLADGKVRPEQLPVIPRDWKLQPRDADAGKQVRAIKALIASADEVVNAGDADREGQLLVDEVLIHLGWRGKTSRLWLSSLDDESVKKALVTTKPNAQYERLYASALGRQRGDWLISLNGSYAMTKRMGDLWPIGRVQTPTLTLLVDRKREIEGFVKRDHYTVKAVLTHPQGGIAAFWMIPEDLTQEGLLLDRKPAEALAAKVPRAMLTVEKFASKKGAREAPLPLSLSGLQKAASKRLGLSAAKVLEAAQELYEAKVATYPRTDCPYLPEEQHGDAARILKALGTGRFPAGVDPSRKHAAWNTAKVEAHHAILPTGQSLPSSLSGAARQVFDLIAESYIRLFMPPERFEQREAVFVFAAPGGAVERFKANSRLVEEAGWMALGKEDKGEGEDEDEESSNLPILRQGERLACEAATVVARQTKPPRPYTDGTLIAAMTGIHKMVQDPKLKTRLRETSGLGTEATRAGIVETLVDRGYAERRKREIHATARGCELVDLLRRIVPEFCDPGTTALQEDRLADIAAGRAQVEEFFRFAEGEAKRICTAILADVPSHPCPECAKGRLWRQVSKAGRPYWRCTECETAFGDVSGKPGAKFGDAPAVSGSRGGNGSEGAAATGPKCPTCKKATFKARTKTEKDYYRCGGCRSAWWPHREDEGKLGTKWPPMGG